MLLFFYLPQNCHQSYTKKFGTLCIRAETDIAAKTPYKIDTQFTGFPLEIREGMSLTVRDKYEGVGAGGVSPPVGDFFAYW